MIIDELELTVKAGDGGEGKVSFGKMAKSGPDGGNGGDGGDVYIIASSDLSLLGQFRGKKFVSAGDGFKGGQKKAAGKRGSDLELLIPIGTLLVDTNTKEKFELSKVGQKLLLCKGGAGGIGNFELRSSTNTTPKNKIPAKPGQVRDLKVVLRFIADFGLIGLPSTGKSSLLNELTRANVKTAPYHFTTLSPNLGVLPNKKIVADIPGLIEGASQGKGLGIRFLKHIEKVNLLLHCIGGDSLDPEKDYKVVRNELGEYKSSLLKKKEIILITKTDLLSEDELNRNIKILKKLNKEVIPTSIHDAESIDNLLSILK